MTSQSSKPKRGSASVASSVDDTAETSASVNDLIAALTHPRVTAVLEQLFSTFLEKTVNKVVDEKLLPIRESINQLSADVAAIKQSASTSTSESLSIKKEIKLSQNSNEEINSYLRRNNILIQGLAVTSYADVSSATSSNDGALSMASSNSRVMESIMNLFNDTLGVNVSAADISTAHIIARANSAGMPSRNQPPPIVVSFVRRSIRDQVFERRKTLKSRLPGVYINEHLTQSASLLFAKARRRMKDGDLSSVFTRNGSVFIKVTTEQSERARKILHADDIQSIINSG